MKFIATVVATLALLLGGAAAITPASAATFSCVDSDGDGYPDGAVDSDGDGELNDPTYPDTDGDGHPDNPCVDPTPLPAGAGDGTDPTADAPAAVTTEPTKAQRPERKAKSKAKGKRKNRAKNRAKR